MAKADMTRDYYADLELPFGAPEVEIKKQFKKLALKYHPDRNPGREAAANSMFQTIQAAHEVLTDPEQRAKYDTMRLKNASGVRYSAYGSSSTSGTRGNPWSSAGSEWAPPPKPPPPRDSERRRPPPSSGAQRWNRFPPNGTTPNPNADAESRRQTYQAWERMRPQPSRARPSQSSREESSGYRRATSPKPSKPDYEGYRDGATHHSPQTSPSRSSSSRYSTKKASFIPGSPGGDEPSASSAYSNYRSTRASTAKRYNPEPPPRNTAPVDPLKQFRDTASGPFEPRQSTPYATHGGEKTNPFEAINNSRWKSTRIRSDKADPPSAEGFSRRGSNDRARSESPPPRHHRHVSSENSVPRADFDAKLGPSPKRNFSSTNRGAKLREHIPLPSEYPASIHITSSSDSDDGEKRGSPDVKHRPYAKTRSPRAARPSQERQPPPEMPNGGKGVSGENTSDLSGSHSYSDPDQAARGGAEGGPKIFSFETYFPSARRASNSVENISTTFSPEDWKGKFEAGDVFRAQASNGTDSRSGSRTRTRTTSPTKRPSTMAQGISDPVNEPHGLRGSRSADTPMMSSGGAKFNAEEWAKTFKTQTFAAPVFPPAPTSARSSRPIRRASKTAGKGSKSASSTTINEYDNPELESYIGRNTDSGGSNERPPIPTPSPNAMDIDPPLPSNEIPKTPTSNENKSGVFEKISSETRHVPLEPQPGWTTGGASGVNAKSGSTIPRQPGLTTKQTSPAKPRRRATRSTDSDDFKTNFEDLQNVEPLYNQATGLNSFDDLASSLPFRSGASTKLQFPRDFSTGKLSLPPLPRPPMIPSIAPNAKRPSESSWQSYLASFTVYMAKWNAFDTKMVNHFVGRQAQVTTMPSGWLGAIGDKAIGEYREGLKQDEEVRDYWRATCSKHQQAIEGFQWFRECMRDGVQKAGPSRERKNTA